MAILKLKLGQHVKHEHGPSNLYNLIFEVEYFCTVLGLEMEYKAVKLYEILLAKKALT